MNTITSQENTDVSRELLRFWEIEELRTSPIPTPEEEFCERHFQRMHSRDSMGRYIVRLPLKQPVGNLLDGTRPRALAFLKRLQDKFNRNLAYEKTYKDHLQEYLDLQHMRRVLEGQNH